eukprot:jgi/Antlo1/104/983
MWAEDSNFGYWRRFRNRHAKCAHSLVQCSLSVFKK